MDDRERLARRAFAFWRDRGKPVTQEQADAEWNELVAKHPGFETIWLEFADNILTEMKGKR